MDTSKNGELKDISYELFIMAVTILSLTNMLFLILFRVQPIDGVVRMVNGVLALFLLADFAYRLISAPSKWGYVVRKWGWADLIGSLPLYSLRILRLFRIVRVIRLLRKYGLRNMIRQYIKHRAGSALLTVTFLIILVVEVGGVLVLRAELDEPNANIKTASDAMWWAYATIATTGFGDRVPVSDTGRLVGIVLMTLGVGLFGVFTGFVARAFLEPGRSRRQAADAQPVEESGMHGAELTGRLEQIQRLLEAQERANAGLAARLGKIEGRLNSEDPKGFVNS